MTVATLRRATVMQHDTGHAEVRARIGQRFFQRHTIVGWIAAQST